MEWHGIVFATFWFVAFVAGKLCANKLLLIALNELKAFVSQIFYAFTILDFLRNCA